MRGTRYAPVMPALSERPMRATKLRGAMRLSVAGGREVGRAGMVCDSPHADHERKRVFAHDLLRDERPKGQLVPVRHTYGTRPS